MERCKKRTEWSSRLVGQAFNGMGEQLAQIADLESELPVLIKVRIPKEGGDEVNYSAALSYDDEEKAFSLAVIKPELSEGLELFIGADGEVLGINDHGALPVAISDYPGGPVTFRAFADSSLKYNVAYCGSEDPVAYAQRIAEQTVSELCEWGSQTWPKNRSNDQGRSL